MLRAKTKYSWERLAGDCAGGFIAALIALPYGLSMAALMGLPPILGVFTSVISTPFVVLLGRNSLLMGGTASATVPFIASAVRTQGIAGAAKISIVASVFMMCFCIMRLGRQVSRVPITVVAGFSAGIGALMVISQLNVMLGVHQSASGIPVVQLIYVLGQASQIHWLPLAAWLHRHRRGICLHAHLTAHTRTACWCCRRCSCGIGFSLERAGGRFSSSRNAAVRRILVDALMTSLICFHPA